MEVDLIKQRMQRILRRVGIDLTRLLHGDGLSDADRNTVKVVQHYTMTSPERIAANCDAARYIVNNGIQGSIVECGVWRGGSMMAVARTLLEHGDTSRDLYLYDTYVGMSEPTDRDKDSRGRSAARGMRRFGRNDPATATGAMPRSRT